jgi:hypothetical protein
LASNSIEALAHFAGATAARTRDSLKNKGAGFIKAQTDGFVNMSKYDRLGKVFNVIEQTRFDLMGQQRYSQSKNSVFNGRTSGIFAWLGDYVTKTQSIAVLMEIDGTRDAYTIDKETEKDIYNPKKDKRHFDEGGKQSVEQKAYMDSLIQDLLQDNRWKGLQEKENEQAVKEGRKPLPVQAYSFKDERRIKSFLSSKVVGSYMAEESPVASSKAWWKFLSVFHRFLYSKIEQRTGGASKLIAGKDIATYKTEESYKVIQFNEDGSAVTDANGHIKYDMVSVKEEGFWLTPVKQVMTMFKKIKDGRMTDIQGWNGLEQHQKYNMTRLGFDAVLLVVLLALREGLGDDDEYLKDKPLLRAAKNGVFTSFEAAPFQVIQHPFTPPPYEYAKRLFKVLTFQGSKYENTAVIPGYGGVKQTLDTTLDLFTYEELETN